VVGGGAAIALGKGRGGSRRAPLAAPPQRHPHTPLFTPPKKVADPELSELTQELELPPYYALSWFITWFAHDVPGLDAAARLFDLFLAVHPLMPLYVGAAAMRSQRRSLLAAGRGEGGMPELHRALNNLDVTRALGADELACQVGGERGWWQGRGVLGPRTAAGPPVGGLLPRPPREYRLPAPPRPVLPPPNPSPRPLPPQKAIELYKRLPPEAILARRSIRVEMAVAPRAFRDK
jgi:hypothetical protein